MKRILFIFFALFTSGFLCAQTTYYWVGGTASASLTAGSSWNTNLDGSGSSRPSSTGATDILVFNGANVGGGTPTTGVVTVLCNGGITCAQIKFINNADIILNRTSGTTSTFVIAGEIGDDFVVEAGSKLSVTPTNGSFRFNMTAAGASGICSGTIIFNNDFQCRFDNGTSGTGKFLFKNGSSFYSAVRAISLSSSYPFGSIAQSAENWVVFEDGAHLYYEGGYSPHGSSSTGSPVFYQPGSFYHHRAASGAGTFFNKKSFGNIVVENGATLATDGPIYRINNLTVNSGCTFTTHTSGQTAVMGNLTVNGTMNGDPASTNELIFAGNSTQTVSGTGVINVPGIIVGNHSSVMLTRNVALTNDAIIYGNINFTDKQITALTDFKAKGIATPEIGAGTTVAGSYVITAHSGISTTARGQRISGPGIPANTIVVSVSVSDDQILISNPATASATGVALTITSAGATLQNSNANGYNPVSGSVIASGNMTFESDINYIINDATAWPFGITTGTSGNMIFTGSVDVNANITVNKGVTIKNNLLVNGKMTLRPSDTLHILSGGNITGTFGTTKYIATDYVTATGVQSVVQYDGIASVKTIPVGTASYYLPVTITPAAASDFTFSAFEGITTNGLVNGTSFTATQKLRVVDAVWNINRLSGSGNADLQLGWDGALEGTTFSTLPDSDIGLIYNIGSGPTGWATPMGMGNNTTNIVMGTATAFGSFGAGAVPQVNAFIYNDLPVKTYGDPDFNGGATSLNTTQPIVYSSSNPAVASIINNNIHIVGAGTADITASQISDGVFPDTSATKQLTVNKAALNIKADDKSRFEGLANPTLTITYTGFVLGETNAVFTTQPSISTTATVASSPGTYPITVSGAAAANYAITYTNGVMTVVAKQNQTITFPQPATKTYGNAPFSTGATSTNNTIPITYTSSNTDVATISGNTITITGAGTTTITAMQAGSDGFFAAPNVARTLTVNKANLTIKVNDATKTTGEVNPTFTITYTGFVLGQSAANLTTQATVSTTATTNSSPGYYDLVPGGATSSNYNITFTNGRLTVLPLTGTSQQYLVAYRNTSGNIAVRVYSPEPYLADVFVYNINGNLIARKNILINNGFASTEIPAQKLASGIYVIAVKGNGVDLKKAIQFIR